MKEIYLRLILLISNSALIGQITTPIKSELKKLFRKSIDQGSQRTIATLSNPRTINNLDNSYFESDTITLINIHNFKDRCHFCKKVNWTFYKKINFIS
ncbi:MAG: hypothetical protein ACJAUH_001070 [Saprospiraceae bacterium]|jgi:hypothetical protein